MATGILDDTLGSKSNANAVQYLLVQSCIRPDEIRPGSEVSMRFHEVFTFLLPQALRFRR